MIKACDVLWCRIVNIKFVDLQRRWSNNDQSWAVKSTSNHHLGMTYVYTTQKSDNKISLQIVTAYILFTYILFRAYIETTQLIPSLQHNWLEAISSAELLMVAESLMRITSSYTVMSHCELLSNILLDITRLSRKSIIRFWKSVAYPGQWKATKLLRLICNLNKKAFQ